MQQKCMGMIPYVRLGMRILNATKRIAPCTGWLNLFFTTQVLKFWIQLSNSSIYAGLPKKNRSESERGVQYTWILHCRICIQIWMPRILDFRSRWQEKTIFLIGLLIRHAHTDILQMFVSKRYLPEQAGDRRSSWKYTFPRFPGNWFFRPCIDYMFHLSVCSLRW